MDEGWAAARSSELLARVASWVDEEHRAGRSHTFLARELAALAKLGDAAEVMAIAMHVLRDAPATAFTAGVMTNIEDRSKLIRRSEPSLEQVLESFPDYEADAVIAYMNATGDAHITQVIEGNRAEARRQAATELAKEEHASTCAVLGYIDEALAFIESSDYPEGRRQGPRMVACVESHRRGDHRRAQQLFELLQGDRGCDPWTGLILAAGFMGRVPWAGYPYPDY